jgi:hypothetical protein
MKCRRVEKLIPLYVERDVASGVAAQITSHLEWCGRCNWLADEYKESQSWLRSSDTPEFDEASLNAMKAGVLSRIEATSAKPSLLASFVQQWGRRQVFALSAAMLVIFGVIVFYVYQTRTSLMPNEVVAADPPKSDREPTNEPSTPNTEKATGADPKQHGPANIQTSSKPRRSRRQAPERTLERSLMSQRRSLPEPGIDISVPQNSVAGSPNDMPEMLRIEIQTSDPNIRIIWFAPKEVEGPKTDQ